MAKQNGNSKWMMWGLGIMLTIGIAAQAGQLRYTNLKFAEHESRPHKDAVPKDRYAELYNKLEEAIKEISALKKEVAVLNERLKVIKG